MNEEKQINLFIEKCRENKLKVTPQRLLIYKELSNTKEHPNTDSIYCKVKASFPNISFDTVYRTLLTFSQIGLADIIVGTGEPRRFDSNTKNHYHFRCLSCGNVYDIENANTDDIKIPDILKDKFEVKNIRVLFEGKCKDCLNGNNLN